MTGITESEIERLLEEPGEAMPRMSGNLVRQNGGAAPADDDLPRFSGKLLNRDKAAPKANPSDTTARDSQGRPLKKGTWVTLRHDKRSRRMKFLGTVQGENGALALRFASINGKEIKHPIPQSLIASMPDLVTPIARPDVAQDDAPAAPAPKAAPAAAPAAPAPAAAPQAGPPKVSNAGLAAANVSRKDLEPPPKPGKEPKAKMTRASQARSTGIKTPFYDSKGQPVTIGQPVMIDNEPGSVESVRGDKLQVVRDRDGQKMLLAQKDINEFDDVLVAYQPTVDDAEAPAEAPQNGPDAAQPPETPEAPEQAPEAPQEAPQAAAAPASPPNNPPNNGGDPVRVDGIPGPVYADVETNYYVHWNPSTHSFAVTKGVTVGGKFQPQKTERITNDQAKDLISKYGNAQGKARVQKIGQPHLGPSEFGEAVKLHIPALNESMVDPSTFECMTGPKTKVKRRKKVRSS